MPSQQAYDVFRDLMKNLMTKTKKQLLDMAMEPGCPDFIQELIMTHPALLGKDVLDYKERESRENDPFVKVTEEIITAHGFKPTYEWEYECDKEHKPQCLRIWLGKKRTKKNLRVLKLTDEETARVQDLLKAETMPKTVDDDTVVSGIVCRKCGNTCPPHTVKRHLDVNDPIHKCPHQ